MPCERCTFPHPHKHLTPHPEEDYRLLRALQREKAANAAMKRRRMVFSPASQCERKKRFPTPEVARHAARRVEQPEVHVYGPCAFCGGWHIGKRVR